MEGKFTCNGCQEYRNLESELANLKVIHEALKATASNQQQEITRLNQLLKGGPKLIMSVMDSERKLEIYDKQFRNMGQIKVAIQEFMGKK